MFFCRKERPQILSLHPAVESVTISRSHCDTRIFDFSYSLIELFEKNKKTKKKSSFRSRRLVERTRSIAFLVFVCNMCVCKCACHIIQTHLHGRERSRKLAKGSEVSSRRNEVRGPRSRTKEDEEKAKDRAEDKIGISSHTMYTHRATRTDISHSTFIRTRTHTHINKKKTNRKRKKK